MAGTTYQVKRAWSYFTQSGTRDAFRAFYEEINNLVGDVATLAGERNRILPGLACGLDVDDGGAQDLETNVAVFVNYFGRVVEIPIDTAIDVSASVTASSSVAAGNLGALWVYADAESSAVCVTEASHPGVASAETLIAGQCRWLGSVHYQSNAGEIPIALVRVTEVAGGGFDWGPDSITAETETYVDLVGEPGVVNDVADIIVTAGASSVTWAHGAGAVVLGDGTFVALTAQTAQPVNALDVTAITAGNSGAFLLYVAADGDAVAMQISSANVGLAAAETAARAELRIGNPYLACIGFLLVENQTNVDFTPGTTDFNTSGVTTKIITLGTMGELDAALLTTPESQD